MKRIPKQLISAWRVLTAERSAVSVSFSKRCRMYTSSAAFQGRIQGSIQGRGEIAPPPLYPSAPYFLPILLQAGFRKCMGFKWLKWKLTLIFVMFYPHSPLSYRNDKGASICNRFNPIKSLKFNTLHIIYKWYLYKRLNKCDIYTTVGKATEKYMFSFFFFGGGEGHFLFKI